MTTICRFLSYGITVGTRQALVVTFDVFDTQPTVDYLAVWVLFDQSTPGPSSTTFPTEIVRLSGSVRPAQVISPSVNGGMHLSFITSLSGSRPVYAGINATITFTPLTSAPCTNPRVYITPGTPIGCQGTCYQNSMACQW
jgi:hypothetical protein